MNTQYSTEKIDHLLNEACSEAKIPGIALVVAKDGEPIYEYYSGYRDVDQKLSINQDTIFGVASITKSFAALAIMQLEDEGILSVDDPVNKWLPEFKTPHNQYVDDIKIKHFMNHTSGLPGMDAVNRARALSKAKDPDGEYISGKEAVNLSDEPVKNVVELINVIAKKNFDLLGPPGTRFNYSNECFAMLQEIIERASGKRLIDYMNEHIFEPLGMTRSVFRIEDLRTFDNVTELYAYTKGKKDVFHSPFWWDVSDIYTNGSLKTSPADLLKYLDVYRCGGSVNGTQIISENSLNKMMTVQSTTPTGRSYGYGLQIDTHHGIELIGHGGSTKGVSSHMKIVPEHGLTALVFVNLAEVASEHLLMIALTELLQIPMPDGRQIQTITLDQDTLQTYAGRYESEEGQKLEIALENDSLIMRDAYVHLRIEPMDTDHFITVSGDKLVFFKDERGHVNGIFKGLRFIPKVI